MYEIQNPAQRAMGGVNQAAGTYGRMMPNTPMSNGGNQPAMGNVSNLVGTGLQGYQAYSAMSTSAAEGGGAAGTGGAGAMGWVGGLGAAIYADELLARKTAGTMNDPEAAWENNVRGITRYGGLTPGQTALLEDKVGRENLDNVFKVFDPAGITEKLEGPVAEATAGTIPEFLGGTGKYDPIGSMIGDFLFG